MMLDISGFDRKKLYEMQRKSATMQAEANMMSDQYSDTSAEAEAVADVGVALGRVLVALDDILMPE